jgi:hypothetical protein
MSRPDKLFFPALLALLLASCGGGDKTDTADIRVSCLGSACAAGGVESYANGSAQVWTYQNTGDTPVTLDLNFSNLARGQELAYVFGNGYSADINSLPSLGQPSAADGSAGKTTVGTSTQAELALRNLSVESQDEWRHRQHEREADLLQLLQPGLGSSAAAGAAVSTTSITPAGATLVTSAVGAQRSWIDGFSGDNKLYGATALSSCQVGNGRKVVTWADETATKGVANSTTLAAIEATLCGDTGAVQRMARLLGNVWGPTSRSNLIQDTPAGLLDINVVLLSVGKDKPWAGYFYGGDTFLKSSVPDSNEALAFYVNADLIAANVDYTLSVLVHELTHMVYWYERSAARGAPRTDTWLSEMVALMSEDIITPAVVSDADGRPYRPITSYRLPAYINSGGGLNMVAWAKMDKANPYYSMAGSFGAYLNRQYGLAIYKRLVTDCLSISNGWACLDRVIKNAGGKGADEEFNRFGLTVFGLGDTNGPSSRFSFPTRVDGDYVLAGLDLSGLSKYRPWKSPEVLSWATGTHSYFVERANVSIFTFTRGGITVPPRSRLNIMIRQGSGT